MSLKQHGLLCRVMSAAIIAAVALVAVPAYADFQGGTATQDLYTMNGTNGNITVNEGSTVSVQLRMRINGGVNSGFAGTTTNRLNPNQVVFSRFGNSGFATSTSNTGGSTTATHTLNGSFFYGQDGPHTVSFADSVPMSAVENSSFGLGQSIPAASSFQSNSRTVTVLNVAPTVTTATQNGTNGTITVAEGSSVALRMQSTDPGADVQTFTINGGGAGNAGGATSGTRTSNIVNQVFGQDGSFTNTFNVADDDTNVSLTRTLGVTNVAPTIVSATQDGSNGNSTVNEGSTVALQMQSTDPGLDAQTFTINGGPAGVGGTSGTRTSSTVNVAAQDQGTLTNTFNVADDDTNVSLNRSVTVNNVAPSLFGLSTPGSILTGQTANFSVSASDPGVLDDLTFAWDLDGDGLFDDAITNQGAGGSASDTVLFTGIPAPPNVLNLGVRVFDGDGGVDTILFNIMVPEPATVVMMGIGAIGLGLIARRRRKQA